MITLLLVLLLAAQKSFKGQCAQFKRVPLAQSGVRHEHGDMSVRKLRTKLARLYEYKRWLSKASLGPLSNIHLSEMRALEVKLQRHFSDLSWLGV